MNTFATLALEEGMDVKTLSAILGHVSSTVSLDVYAHSTTKMQQVAASAIDRRISKSRAIMFVPGNMTPLPEKKAFVPKARKYRKSGTGCISKIGENLFEGKYSPKWIDGKKRQTCDSSSSSLVILQYYMNTCPKERTAVII